MARLARSSVTDVAETFGAAPELRRRSRSPCWLHRDMAVPGRASQGCGAMRWRLRRTTTVKAAVASSDRWAYMMSLDNRL